MNQWVVPYGLESMAEDKFQTFKYKSLDLKNIYYQLINIITVK